MFYILFSIRYVKKKDLFQPPSMYLKPWSHTDLMYKWSLNVILWHFLVEMGHASSYSWKARLTDELCHCAIFEANDVTSTYLFKIQQNLVLSFEVGLLFVGLFNKLFMTKCEQVFDWN